RLAVQRLHVRHALGHGRRWAVLRYRRSLGQFRTHLHLLPYPSPLSSHEPQHRSAHSPGGAHVGLDFTSPKRLGLPRQLLEAMLIEGDLTREDVDEFVTGLLSGYDNLVV